MSYICIPFRVVRYFFKIRCSRFLRETLLISTCKYTEIFLNWFYGQIFAKNTFTGLKQGNKESPYF